MAILAIVAYAGSKKLVSMTEQMLHDFKICALAIDIPTRIVAINNAAERPISPHLFDWHATMDKNEGFGVAINLGIQREIFDMTKAGFPDDVTHVLVLNNDLQFPDPRWLNELLKEREGSLVLSPCTDVTATAAAVNDRAFDQCARRVAQVSAFCWLVPRTTINRLRKGFGFNLFNPDFSNYGSDDVTAACLRRFDAKPFKIVPRSFVKHLKAQTANELGVKAGTPGLLQRISNFKRSKRLT